MICVQNSEAQHNQQFLFESFVSNFEDPVTFLCHSLMGRPCSSLPNEAGAGVGVGGARGDKQSANAYDKNSMFGVNFGWI